MTRADHASGSDRIFEAVEKLDPEGRHDVVVNVQGDLPTIDPAAIAASILPLSDRGGRSGDPGRRHPARRGADQSQRGEDGGQPDLAGPLPGALLHPRDRALWRGPLYHHIGLYAYRRKALQRFVGLPPSPLELREKLEQLRALEAGMRIDAVVVDDVPLGVDTPHDLERARDDHRGGRRGA